MKTYIFLRKHNRAMAAMIAGVVALAVGVILIGAVTLPTIFTFTGADTMTCGTYANNTCGNAWNGATIAMWGVVPILAIVYLYTIVMGP
jgi:hypothetical protein